ncbi:alpha-L-arabinofuranosidase C-terminal domain-containing protein [Xylanibacter muris]|uniref:non-reducing end alpha-L-arabinofuranosidase n=1 Tax=Xylanibacter muris TaxID=2736290 RepID=A0ABX2ALI8_9BACT|nr:alpha-L-arabinofuranosidase C-terminal domain-containing protein [Xylanibacter muris]NPD91060.1 alpha-N-arabinofuranosidase 1 [Xylanibacter muris]
MKRLLTFWILCAIAISMVAQVSMTIDATRRGPHIGPYHNGLFFEEINHAGDGGLYAELVSNRSFEDGLANWTAYKGTEISLKTKGLLNDAQAHALSVTISGASESNMKGIANSGYWGMNIVKDSTYNLSMWVKGDAAFNNKIIAQLRSNDGKSILGRAVLKGTVNNTGWNRLSVSIKATASDNRGQLLLLTGTNGHLDLDVVSLFPYTWKNRSNGLRPALAQLLADTRPSFLRFPGGCYVEGEGSYGNAFQWKKTIGPIEQRPGHYNKNWHYWSSDGLGFDEYLQMCEDLGAAPMFVVNIGLGHGFSLSHDSTLILVQDVLDAIEYANGDADTEWGARRIANGHAAPYNLKFIEIGNENYSPGANSEYAERYILFYDAIKAKYPEIVTIGNVEAWGTDNPSWGNNYPVEIVDEHYYRTFQWMRSNYNKYDNYPRFPIVYNGEYAANGGGYGKYGNMNSALGEAIYMLGMERNSDVCRMASFAPIFTHEEDPRWAYDMIHFNASDNFVTPSYYVQKLMNINLGKQNLLWTESGNRLSNISDVKVGLGSWGTQVVYDDVSVIGSDGNIVASDNFNGGIGAWIVNDGNWNVSDGTLVQSSLAENCTAVMNIPMNGNYTYKVRAMKTGGNEGFLILFNYQDGQNYVWWNIGGWSNSKHAVEVCSNGSKSTVAEKSGRVENNRWYDIEVKVDGANITCLLDNKVVHEFTMSADRALYQSVQIDEDKGELILKVVNPNSEGQTLKLNILNMRIADGTVVRLLSNAGTDENTMQTPDVIVPTEGETVAVDDDTHATLEIPAYSLNIFRLGASAIGEEVKISYSEYEKEDENMGAYLYAHMNGHGEYTNYALSLYGNNWQDMLGGAEVFDTKANTVTGGMRDAYITRMHDGNFMLAGTDMTSRLGWTSNHIMVLMLSPDLVHWTKNVKIDLESAENLEALGGITAEEMTAAWAPQVIYDKESGNYVVYYSVGFPDRHRIYYSIVDKDLNILSRPALYFDPGYDVIDADIVWNDVDKQYVMIYKCEKTTGFDRATADHLIPNANETKGTCQWTVTPNFHFGDNNQAIEAPTQWRRIGSDKWTLAYINYSGNGYGYKMCSMDEHGLNIGSPSIINGNVDAQHGSILKITTEEYDYLKTWEKVKMLLPKVESYYKACKVEAIGDAIAKAEKALNTTTTFAQNVKAMEAAYAALLGCEDIYLEYIKQMGEAGAAVDMTALIVNPDFREGARGWSTSVNFTQANGYVAEFWNTAFDFYQIIENMPKGEYELGVQSFYRYGSISDAVNAHNNGTERLNAVLYANGAEVPVMSIYDESVTQYTHSPYTYPDNVTVANEAFNDYGLYTNTVKLTLDEAGQIKLGIRKKEHISSDWCCFDNFTLKYLGNPDAINKISQGNGRSKKKYNLEGQEVKGRKSYKDIYIVNGKKIIE